MLDSVSFTARQGQLLHGEAVPTITHRRYKMVEAHQVAVLDGGRVVQQGTPGELMTEVSLYRHIVELQKESIQWRLK